ncbi:MAG: Peptidase [Myxococcales bacterium]|nr:Peptidase [Myxococcales bacterium]
MKTLQLTVVALGFVIVGCASEPQSQPPTWEEFMAQVTIEPETGVFIVNGDEMIESEAELAVFYNGMVAQWAGASVGETSDALIVNRVGSRDDKWSSTTAANLTYCVSQSSFGSRYNTVVNAMNSAAAAWEGTARVNFVHRSDQDGNCTASNGNVMFDVRQTSTTSYLARSFFPSTGRSSRNVLISTSSFGNISPYSLAGVLRHELGHTIGFRHEHTRPEAGTCFEDNSWRALTSYDSASVMHYPQCNGSNRGDLVLTSRDKTGARSLYP